MDEFDKVRTSIKNGEIDTDGYVKVLFKWEPLAKQGDPWAQFIMGMLCTKGKVVQDAFEKRDKIVFEKFSEEEQKERKEPHNNVLSRELQASYNYPSFPVAYMWYSFAAFNGLPDGEVAKEILKKQMNNDEMERATRLFNHHLPNYKNKIIHS